MTYYHIHPTALAGFKRCEFTTLPGEFCASRRPIYLFQLNLARICSRSVPVDDHYRFAFRLLQVTYFEQVLNLDTFKTTLFIAMLSLQRTVMKPEGWVIDSLQYFIECIPEAERAEYLREFRNITLKSDKRHRAAKQKSNSSALLSSKSRHR